MKQLIVLKPQFYKLVPIQARIFGPKSIAIFIFAEILMEPIIPSHDVCREVLAAEAALAASAVLPLAAGRTRRKPAKTNALPVQATAPVPVDEHAILASLIDATTKIAALKTISVTPELCHVIAVDARAALDDAALGRYLDADPATTQRVTATLNLLLDKTAAVTVIGMIRHLEGFDLDDSAAIDTEACDWLQAHAANDGVNRCMRWPDPVAMVTAHYRARASGPVAIRYPADRPIRAVYQFDREASYARTSPQPGAMPAPLLIRCKGVPGNPGFVPHGRHVATKADGNVLTCHWRQGHLHRDPADGPAWSLSDAAGAVIAQEYWIDGAWLDNAGAEPGDGEAAGD